MSRLYKCWYCNGRDIDGNMKIIKNGSVNRRYHKDKCYDLQIKENEFNEKEKKEMSELIETIKDVHDIKIIPSQFYPYIQDLRNGNEMFGRIGKKRVKEGYPYSVISQTYKECKDSILWAMNNREFRDSLNFLKYTRAIVVNKIEEVNARIKERERQERDFKTPVDPNIADIYNTQFNYKEEDDEMDISKFLGGG